MHFLDLKIFHLLQHELHLWLPVVPKWFLAPEGCAGLLVATMGKGLLSSCPSATQASPDVQGASI